MQLCDVGRGVGGLLVGCGEGSRWCCSVATYFGAAVFRGGSTVVQLEGVVFVVHSWPSPFTENAWPLDEALDGDT